MKKQITLMVVIMLMCVIGICFAVGSTRTSGTAGAAISLNAYLSGDLSEAQVPITVANTSWEYGTGAGAANVIYADKISLADANAVTVDLYASGTYTDIFNRALTLSALKLLYIKNNSTDATLLVGRWIFFAV